MRLRFSPSPVRLHVLLARGAARGLILYNTGQWVCTIDWDRVNDTFTLGQCLKGRINPYRCDLSPDGEHFIYSASSNRYHDYNPPQGKPHYWTALSRSPYLKAIGFWPNTWGGGMFVDNENFHLAHHAPAEGEIWPINFSPTNVGPPPEEFGRRYAEYGLSYHQAVRNEWHVKAQCDEKHIIGIMEKKQTTWTLRRFSRYGSAPYGKLSCSNGFWEWYNIHNAHGETLGGHDWEWADFDGDRLVWTQGYRLFAMEIWNDGRGQITQLADFSSWNHQIVKAPY